jgi:hypothetical protein
MTLFYLENLTFYERVLKPLACVELVHEAPKKTEITTF